MRNGVPDGYHSVTPYLAGNPADTLIRFLEAAFDGVVVERHEREDGGVAHAEVVIGDSRIMICDPRPEDPVNKASLYLYVPDADALYERAISAGAESLSPPMDMPYGDRHGGVVDPSGNQWWIATRLNAGADSTR